MQRGQNEGKQEQEGRKAKTNSEKNEEKRTDAQEK